MRLICPVFFMTSLLFVLLAPPTVSPTLAQDAADLVVRTGRLETQIRQLSGQVEQLQFENRQLRDQLRRFQEDVEARFLERSGGTPNRPQQSPSSSLPSPVTQTVPQRRSETSGPASIADVIASEQAGTGPLDLNSVGRSAAQAPPRSAPSVAASASGNPQADYEAAYAWLLQKQYEQAEMGFRQFLQSHPRSRLAPDATYWLGESYFQRSRHREGAEQFLKVTTDSATSTKAPDAMLRLGQSLLALGAKDQACATFTELDRKYPQASPNLRQSTERERSRARC
jgi:tol-pal system protein YbgF